MSRQSIFRSVFARRYLHCSLLHQITEHLYHERGDTTRCKEISNLNKQSKVKDRLIRYCLFRTDLLISYLIVNVKGYGVTTADSSVLWRLPRQGVATAFNREVMHICPSALSQISCTDPLERIRWSTLLEVFTYFHCFTVHVVELLNYYTNYCTYIKCIKFYTLK
jgi:hypothetical protein